MTNRKIILFLILFINSIFIIYSQDNTLQQNNAQEKVNTLADIEESMKIIDTEEPGNQNNEDPETEGNRSLVTFTVWDFFRMVIVLVFVAACIYGLVFLLKKASTGKYDESEIIKIVSGKTVAPGKSLHIIEVGNQMMIIGISDDSITHIADITDKETYEQIKLYKGENDAPAGESFYSYLSKVISPGKKRKGRKQNIGALLEKHKKRMEKL